jgi:hypothetical protein
MHTIPTNTISHQVGVHSIAIVGIINGAIEIRRYANLVVGASAQLSNTEGIRHSRTAIDGATGFTDWIQWRNLRQACFRRNRQGY